MIEQQRLTPGSLGLVRDNARSNPMEPAAVITKALGPKPRYHTLRSKAASFYGKNPFHMSFLIAALLFAIIVYRAFVLKAHTEKPSHPRCEETRIRPGAPITTSFAVILDCGRLAAAVAFRLLTRSHRRRERLALRMSGSVTLFKPCAARRP